jgi:hypothetical protein
MDRWACYFALTNIISLLLEYFFSMLFAFFIIGPIFKIIFLLGAHPVFKIYSKILLNSKNTRIYFLLLKLIY